MLVQVLSCEGRAPRIAPREAPGRSRRRRRRPARVRPGAWRMGAVCRARCHRRRRTHSTARTRGVSSRSGGQPPPVRNRLEVGAARSCCCSGRCHSAVAQPVIGPRSQGRPIPLVRCRVAVRRSCSSCRSLIESSSTVAPADPAAIRRLYGVVLQTRSIVTQH
jgi:hypothetical protein